MLPTTGAPDWLAVVDHGTSALVAGLKRTPRAIRRCRERTQRSIDWLLSEACRPISGGMDPTAMSAMVAFSIARGCARCRGCDGVDNPLATA